MFDRLGVETNLVDSTGVAANLTNSALDAYVIYWHAPRLEKVDLRRGLDISKAITYELARFRAAERREPLITHLD
jgi:hypothetical protein